MARDTGAGETARAQLRFLTTGRQDDLAGRAAVIPRRY
jgi:hypothetical protein